MENYIKRIIKRFLENGEKKKSEREGIEKEIILSQIVSKGLGVDYGLIFINNLSDKISAIFDGKKKWFDLTYNVEFGDYNKLFFDDLVNKLYYTQENCLYTWPKILVKDFRTKISGIGKYLEEILVCLYDEGKISDSEGNIKYKNVRAPLEIASFQI